MHDDPSADETLDEKTCWEQLHTSGLGRLATGAKGIVDIFPVNYLVHEQRILFRTAPGTKLVNLTAAPLVAFEADGFDGRWHWSVVIHGRARRLDNDADIAESGVMNLVPWSSTPSTTTFALPRPISRGGVSIDSCFREQVSPADY